MATADMILYRNLARINKEHRSLHRVPVLPLEEWREASNPEEHKLAAYDSDVEGGIGACDFLFRASPHNQVSLRSISSEVPWSACTYWNSIRVF